MNDRPANRDEFGARGFAVGTLAPDSFAIRATLPDASKTENLCAMVNHTRRAGVRNVQHVDPLTVLDRVSLKDITRPPCQASGSTAHSVSVSSAE